MFNDVIVMGGSISGMLMARVLSPHAKRVIMIERDQLPDEFVERSGVPHGSQLHHLMPHGLKVLETLFPDIKQQFIDDGMEEVHMGFTSRFMTYGHWHPIVKSEARTLALTRPYFEGTLRNFVCRLPNIEFMQRTQVNCLLFENDKVVGVQTQSRPVSQSEAVDHYADLVVDATGRTSSNIEWLAEGGYPAPDVTTIDPLLGYVTRKYRRPKNFNPDWNLIYIMSAPPHGKRAGAVYCNDNDLLTVLLGGLNGDYPPTDDVGFNEFAKTLPAPDVYNLIQEAEPLNDAQSYRNTSNMWRHFEKLDRMPKQFIITGDAACVVNPIYGQGMTKAILNAKILESQLRQGDFTAQKFHQTQARINQDFWDISSNADLGYAGTVSNVQSNLLEKLKQIYLGMVLRAVPHNEVIARNFQRVLAMESSLYRLLMPDVLLRVLLNRHKSS